MFFVYSCTEEQIGQYPVDDIPPQEVLNPVVENFKGGASITYDLPGDKDLQYVKAVYSLPTGEVKEKLASSFINELTIEGFARAAKTNVNLISVDKSRNESDPVIIEIEPADSPIFDVYASLAVVASFGGIKITWENPEQKDIVVGVVIKNEDGTYDQVESFYTSVSNGLGAVRGMEPVETEFGVYIRDVYDNYTDTLITVLSPWEESELDKDQWRGLPLCSEFSLSQWGKPIECMWDGATTNSDFYYINRTSSTPIFFTMDLGVTTKLSRFKFWARNGYYFNLHHPKEFEVWGTNDPAIANANGDACSWDGWELLYTGISEKPSGPDVVSQSNLSSEDLALAMSGEEFEFPLEVPEVRYIRFRTLRTWTDSNSSFIAELTFWGQINE